MNHHRTLALVGVVVFTAAAVLVLSRGIGEKPGRGSSASEISATAAPPRVELVQGTSEVHITPATPGRTEATVREPVSGARLPAVGLPGAPSGKYELAGPGDRNPVPPPDFLRTLSGSFDDSKGMPLFASFCSYSHSRSDDPMVFPRRPGDSHLHDFFGNLATDAYSTDDSLRRAGRTTCNFPGDSAAYWVPALYENGQRIKPDFVGAYYMPGAKDHRTIEPFPRGLKLLVKDAKAAMWYCVGNAMGEFSKEPRRCPMDQHLGLQIVFPDCWDGKYLDVPDHRKHMAYAEGTKCPASHPVPVPLLTLFVDYKWAQGVDTILAPVDAPSSPHADFVNSWDQAKLTKFVRDCINAGVHCGSTPPP